VATPSVPSKALPTDLGQVQAFLDRAHNGDETTLPVLREMLQVPAIVEHCGNLAAHVEDTLIRKLAGQDLAVREGLRRKLESLRAELGGPTATPLERLLVERIAACWLHLNHLETNYVGMDKMPLELATYYQRSISAAHKRYLSAIKTLAVVRKLAVPVLQVNIAKQQVNMAGPVVASGGPPAPDGG
jgi:hypothetical protein